MTAKFISQYLKHDSLINVPTFKT